MIERIRTPVLFIVTFLLIVAATAAGLKSLYYIEIDFIHKARQAKHDCEWILPRSEGCHMIYVPTKETPKITHLKR